MSQLAQLSESPAQPVQASGQAARVQLNIQRVSGFGPMARVMTSFGQVHAHVLRQGDIVRTNAGRFLPIKAIDRIRLDEDFLTRYPSALPVRVRANALGPGLPKSDMILAPYQMVRVGPPNLQSPAVAAVKLLERPFVDRVRENQITYTRISLGTPCFVSCEGVWNELPV